MDFKILASRLGLDEDDFNELVGLFITTTLSDIDKIKKSVQESSSKGAADASHSIKGASGNLGFDDIFQLTQKMEMQALNGSLDNFEEYLHELENGVNALNNLL